MSEMPHFSDVFAEGLDGYTSFFPRGLSRWPTCLLDWNKFPEVQMLRTFRQVCHDRVAFFQLKTGTAVELAYWNLVYHVGRLFLNGVFWMSNFFIACRQCH
jgi:hypothetical protein